MPKVIRRQIRTVAAILLTAAGALHAQKWTMVALADPLQDRGWPSALNAAQKKATSPIKFVLVSGDYNPLEYNLKQYDAAFPDKATRPYLVPALGNHEIGQPERRSQFDLSVKVVQGNPHAKSRDGKMNYHVDYRNVRIINVNQYSDWGNELGYNKGCINAKGKAWVDSLITSASATEHVFVQFHEPAFPRKRHVGDSFDQCPEDRNAFWDMLVKHKNKVRAVLVGHTHNTYKMRVRDPRGPASKNVSSYPDEEGGILQIDMGQVHRSLNIEIDGSRLSFNIWDHQLRLVDSWTLQGATVAVQPLQEMGIIHPQPQARRVIGAGQIGFRRGGQGVDSSATYKTDGSLLPTHTITAPNRK